MKRIVPRMHRATGQQGTPNMLKRRLPNPHAADPAVGDVLGHPSVGLDRI